MNSDTEEINSSDCIRKNPFFSHNSSYIFKKMRDSLPLMFCVVLIVTVVVRTSTGFRPFSPTTTVLQGGMTPRTANARSSVEWTQKTTLQQFTITPQSYSYSASYNLFATSDTDAEEEPKRRRKRVKRKESESTASALTDEKEEEEEEQEQEQGEQPPIEFKPRRQDATVNLQVKDVRELVNEGSSRAVSSTSNPSSMRMASSTSTLGSARTTTTMSSTSTSTSSTDTTNDSLEMLLQDAKEFQAQDVSSSGEGGGFSIPDTIKNALSTLVTVDFFVVCVFLVWFLAGIFCSYVLKDDTVQIAFNRKWCLIWLWS